MLCKIKQSVLSESLAEDMWICGVPHGPPPPYEVAIRMPSSPPDASPNTVVVPRNKTAQRK
ncbi:hypothetical protein ANCDUO_19942 [Ancylostoma duodenale]|uniref:Uncharacterized protein n=1 Tax=Ancylostoma duodenale TaxID=51022 RepID=A0A0C2CJM8_9BILA|nr:hypothetical protein ANCDUO_19942 [Ancylostoma duodenale]